MFPSADTSACSPLPSSGFRGRPLREPCGSPPSRVLWGRTTAPPSIHGHLRSPLAAGTSPDGRRWRALLGSWGIPLEACPELVTPATPARPRIIGRPDAAFRLVNSVGIAISRFSELNLRGLLPCCVRFAPTGHPVNGNTGYRPAGSLWPGGTRTRWIPLRGFTGSFQLLLFQAFPNAICGVLHLHVDAKVPKPLKEPLGQTVLVAPHARCQS